MDPDSYRNNNHRGAHPKVMIGSFVKVFDSNTGKWVEAEVEKMDSIQHNVFVKYLKPPHSRVLVSTRDIRQIVPASNNNRVANSNHKKQALHEHPSQSNMHAHNNNNHEASVVNLASMQMHNNKNKMTS